MSTFTQRIVHLHSCRGSTWRLLAAIYEADPFLEEIYTYRLSELEKKFQLRSNQAQRFYYDLHHYSPEKIYQTYVSQGISILTVFDKGYPLLLKQIYDPPWVLYAIGNLSLLTSAKLLAVVGTRYPTEYGYTSLKKLIPPLIKDGWTIVSGMAKGIDRFAHEHAVYSQGHTIAVLGSGLMQPYPTENNSLFQYLSKHQLILSEYPPYVPANKWQFPARNRIISGLSKGVLIIEAKEKSGSLITADQALDQGRDVFAVPGPIDSQQSDGTNHLIQQGAILTRTAEDIICEYYHRQK
ncbi:DNA-processing protein DprA [Halalkalibacter urbisdiaboli]|uniref:DNA-processing protein DprA n=1 Tax=Halalkalibacter urbisdiaboli TaxID=1960589 RepID=UPI000B4536D6|nr:DNA-processing protein DprA [Halalkalibacter urbisdiaboli]